MLKSCTNVKSLFSIWEEPSNYDWLGSRPPNPKQEGLQLGALLLLGPKFRINSLFTIINRPFTMGANSVNLNQHALVPIV